MTLENDARISLFSIFSDLPAHILILRFKYGFNQNKWIAWSEIESEHAAQP
jgi:hypothetical protein